MKSNTNKKEKKDKQKNITKKENDKELIMKVKKIFENKLNILIAIIGLILLFVVLYFTLFKKISNNLIICLVIWIKIVY